MGKMCKMKLVKSSGALSALWKKKLHPNCEARIRNPLEMRRRAYLNMWFSASLARPATNPTALAKKMSLADNVPEADVQSYYPRSICLNELFMLYANLTRLVRDYTRNNMVPSTAA